MATKHFYLAAAHKDYEERWDAIVDKSEWIRKHMDADRLEEMGQSIDGHIPVDEVVLPTPNVPRPPEVSVYRWNQHLQDNGFTIPEEQ